MEKKYKTAPHAETFDNCRTGLQQLRFLLLALVVRLARFYIIIIVHRVTYYTHPPNTTHTHTRFTSETIPISDDVSSRTRSIIVFHFSSCSTDMMRTDLYTSYGWNG